MAIEPVTYVSWSDLRGFRPTETEVRKDLSVLGRQQSVELLARLGSLLYLDVTDRETEKTRDLQRFLVANLVDDELLLALKKRYGHNKIERRVCFHLQQVLTVLKWVILNASPSVATDFEKDVAARYALGRCLIKTNDLLFGGKIAELFAESKQTISKCLAIQLSAGPTFEVNNPPPLVASVVKSDSIFGDLAKSETGKIDVPSVFESATGLPLDAYMDMTIGVLSHFLSRERKQFLEDPGQSILNPKTFFGSLTGT